MDVDRQGIILSYDRLEGVELPREVLYDVVVDLRHRAGGEARQQLAQAMRAFAGQPQRRRLPWGPALRFCQGAYNLDVRLREGAVRIEARNRLQPRGLQRIVAAVASLPGARDLRIEATVPHYSEGLSNLRACTPCQASSLR